MTSHQSAASSTTTSSDREVRDPVRGRTVEMPAETWRRAVDGLNYAAELACRTADPDVSDDDLRAWEDAARQIETARGGHLPADHLLAQAIELGLDMLDAFHPTDSGHRARVGQVQIGKWKDRLDRLSQAAAVAGWSFGAGASSNCPAVTTGEADRNPEG